MDKYDRIFRLRSRLRGMYDEAVDISDMFEATEREFVKLAADKIEDAIEALNSALARD
jgi:hypothetical protein